MELKYKVADVEKMIDVFNTLSEVRDANKAAELMANAELIAKATEKLSDYPTDIIEEFLICINDLESKNISASKDNYQGILGYIMIRLNLK